MLSATPFEDLLVGSEVSEAFVIRFTGPLGGTGRRKDHVPSRLHGSRQPRQKQGPVCTCGLLLPVTESTEGCHTSPGAPPQKSPGFLSTYSLYEQSPAASPHTSMGTGPVLHLRLVLYTADVSNQRLSLRSRPPLCLGA